MISKEHLIEIGNQLGFELVRVCSAEPFTEYERTINDRINAGFYPEELLVHEGVREFCLDPNICLPGARSIISMGFRYYSDLLTDLTRPGDPHGVLARANQRDVYAEVRRRTDMFTEILREKGVKVAERSHVPHKMAALRAGLGYQGKNSLIQTKDFGSWVTLSSLITDANLEADEPQKNNCGSCQACVKACPTKAIIEPGVVRGSRCIDYLAGKTGAIPRELREGMGNRIVSCDICQDVCPNNRGAKGVEKGIPQFDPFYRRSPSLIPLLEISEEDFRRNFLNCGFMDFEGEYLKRNAAVALGNIGDPVAIEPLARALKGGSYILRIHSAWALGRFEDVEAKGALRDVLSMEENEEVAKEIAMAMEK